MQSASAIQNLEKNNFEEYLAQGASRALALDNRGPIRRTPSGEINSEILNSYWRHGFYIFEDVFNAEELKDLEADF